MVDIRDLPADLNQAIWKSRRILVDALEEIDPRAVVSLVSGGDGSLTAYYVLKLLGIPADYIVHVDTGTGIPQTRAFVEQWASNEAELLVGEAGDDYELYVRRKGFFGRGYDAHAMAYHVLKATPLRKMISSIRQRRRSFPVLMPTGIRLDESDNRKYNFATKTVKPDPAAPNNIFVNHIEHWTKSQCKQFLSLVEAPRNPVTQAMHRSGECMRGTMQDKEDRQLASILYPEWGQKLNALESEAVSQHGWGWGEEMPKSIKQRRAGQLPLLIDGMEMRRHCLFSGEAQES